MEHSLLQHFIQLIQLWAAICLLFFYAELPLLKSSPLSKRIRALDQIFKDFISKHNVVAKRKVYDPTKWENFQPRIRSMAAMSFFYCVFLLVYIGAERTAESGFLIYPIQHPSFLIIINCLILLYLIPCSLINRGFFRTYAIPVLFFILFFVLFFCFESLNKLLYFDKFTNCIIQKNTWLWVTIITLIVCFIGVFLIIIRVSFDIFKINKIRRRLEKLDIEFKKYNDIIKELIIGVDYSQLSNYAKGIINPFLTIDEDLYNKNKQMIIDCVHHLNDNNALSYEPGLGNAIITDIQTKESYALLNTETKEIIRQICINAKYFIMDRHIITKRITAIKTDNFKKEFKDFLVDEEQDIQADQNKQDGLSQTKRSRRIVKPIRKKRKHRRNRQALQSMQTGQTKANVVNKKTKGNKNTKYNNNNKNKRKNKRKLRRHH